MVTRCSSVTELDAAEWSRLVTRSSNATWFQSNEAYKFYQSQQELFSPFAYGVFTDDELKGICVGYITREKNALKQYLTRRAIIIGGPMLADDISDDELMTLLQTIKNDLKHKAIYIETRNFNDYSRWKETFLKNGFEYVPHLNFHVHTNQPWDIIESNIGKHRKKYIRMSFRDGAQIIEKPTAGQVEEYYNVLEELYRTKVHMPCFPLPFFKQLYELNSCRFLLVSYDNVIIGGSVCMTLQDKGVYEWFACGRDGICKNIYPSSVTKYAGMKYAADHGFPVFDMMGAGKPNEPYGVRDFKAEFGGELVEHGRFLCVNKPLLYNIGRIGVKVLKHI